MFNNFVLDFCEIVCRLFLENFVCSSTFDVKGSGYGMVELKNFKMMFSLAMWMPCPAPHKAVLIFFYGKLIFWKFFLEKVVVVSAQFLLVKSFLHG